MISRTYRPYSNVWPAHGFHTGEYPLVFGRLKKILTFGSLNLVEFHLHDKSLLITYVILSQLIDMLLRCK